MTMRDGAGGIFGLGRPEQGLASDRGMGGRVRLLGGAQSENYVQRGTRFGRAARQLSSRRLARLPDTCRLDFPGYGRRVCRASVEH